MPTLENRRQCLLSRSTLTRPTSRTYIGSSRSSAHSSSSTCKRPTSGTQTDSASETDQMDKATTA